MTIKGTGLKMELSCRVPMKGIFFMANSLYNVGGVTYLFLFFAELLTTCISGDGFLERKNNMKLLASAFLNLVATMNTTKSKNSITWLKLRKTRNKANVSLNLWFLANERTSTSGFLLVLWLTIS